MDLKTATAHIGARVRYHPIIGLKHDGKLYRLRAVERMDGEDVAWLDGKRGFVSIDALSPGPQPLVKRAEVAPCAMSSCGLRKEPGQPWTLLPPPPGTCPLCARSHKPEEPHDAQMLHYQYRFYFTYGRWPTWADAVAHCNDKTRAYWERELRALDAWTQPPDGVAPIAEPCPAHERACDHKEIVT